MASNEFGSKKDKKVDIKPQTDTRDERKEKKDGIGLLSAGMKWNFVLYAVLTMVVSVDRSVWVDIYVWICLAEYVYINNKMNRLDVLKMKVCMGLMFGYDAVYLYSTSFGLWTYKDPHNTKYHLYVRRGLIVASVCLFIVRVVSFFKISAVSLMYSGREDTTIRDITVDLNRIKIDRSFSSSSASANLL